MLYQLLWVEEYIKTSGMDIEEFKPNKGFESLPKIVSSFDLDKIYGER